MWTTNWRAKKREISVRDCRHPSASGIPWVQTYLARVGAWIRPFDSSRGVVADLLAAMMLFVKAGTKEFGKEKWA